MVGEVYTEESVSFLKSPSVLSNPLKSITSALPTLLFPFHRYFSKRSLEAMICIRLRLSIFLLFLKLTLGTQTHRQEGMQKKKKRAVDK